MNSINETSVNTDTLEEQVIKQKLNEFITQTKLCVVSQTNLDINMNKQRKLSNDIREYMNEHNLESIAVDDFIINIEDLSKTQV